MIQRRQTLYLLSIVILGIIMFFRSVVQFTTPETAPIQRVFLLSAQGLEETTFELEYTEVTKPLEVKGLWGLTVITLLIPFLALVDIFLYKRRLLQARLNIFTAVTCIGYYAMVFMYVWYIRNHNKDLNLDWDICFAACIPLVSLILVIGATRLILKDEMMVKAADRIR